MSNHGEAVGKRSDDEFEPRRAPVVFLCARRQSALEPLVQFAPPVIERGFGARAGYAAIACVGTGLLLLLWPIARLAGVFGWSDADERE